MKKIHFIGIGGIGMSALAEVALASGWKVTGSDLRSNDLTGRLEKKGAIFFKGHETINVPFDADLVVRSTSIRQDNPEIIKAKELGIKIIPRSDMLKELMKNAGTSIGVTGTHGKTTTSALVSYIMEFDGRDPTVIVGGEMELFGNNAKAGSNDLLIAEVDESDGHFRTMETTSAIITNIEREHMEHYGSMRRLVDSYEFFVSGIYEKGLLVYNAEDEHLKSVSETSRARRVTFGIEKEYGPDYTCEGLYTAKSISFELIRGGKKLGKLESSLIGRHNCMNILAASALCLEMGVDFPTLQRAVREFKSVKRRFDLVGKAGGVEVYEDYAHHPTELAAVIKAAAEYKEKGKLVAVFQPHRHSRTHDLADEFLHCFYGAEALILTDVYSADEDKIQGFGIKDIFDKIDKTKFESVKLMEKDKIPQYAARAVGGEGLVLVLGAGDIREIARPILDEIRKIKKC